MDIIRRKWKRSYYKYSGQDKLERGEKKILWMLERQNNCNIYHTNRLSVSQGRQKKREEIIENRMGVNVIENLKTIEKNQLNQKLVLGKEPQN